MTEKIRILFLSANPWTTSRILVDEEVREIFEKLQEGPQRERFILHKHAAIRPADIQRLLMMYRPQIVHFSGHSSKKQKLILGGVPGRGKQINRRALVNVLALYPHVRLVFLNACFTRTQARSLSEVIDYSIGARKPIGDRESVIFAGAFYRALGFGRSIREAFDSAKVELALANMTRAQSLELFVRKGVDESDRFPPSTPGFENQLVNSFPCTHRPLPEVNTQFAGALTSGNGDTETVCDAFHLQRQSVVNRAGETIVREQIILTYEQTRQLCSSGSMQPDHIKPLLPVRTALESLGRPQRRQSSRSLKTAGVASLPLAVACTASAVTVEHRVLTLTQPSAKCRRMHEDSGVRGVGANEKRSRCPRRRRD